jgi:hypothetical protein
MVLGLIFSQRRRKKPEAPSNIEFRDASDSAHRFVLPRENFQNIEAAGIKVGV